MLSNSSVDSEIIMGFTEGMTENGYVENVNVKYLYNQPFNMDDENITKGIKTLLAQDIDLLLTMGNKTALLAKQLVRGTDIPVIFSSNPWPVESGMVESLKHPGGNLTGIRFPDTTPKTLEMLQSIDPGIKKVVIPYNPEDEVSLDQFPVLNQTARQLGIEIILQEVRSVKEAVASIEGLPENVDAVFMITAPALKAGRLEISQAVNKRGFVSGSVIFDDAVLLSLFPDIFNAGKKTAHIVHQIIMGNKPGDLPVETCDAIFSVNIKTAEQIGVTIPEVILFQANKIIR
jgi:putative ABC transport system substrate-binding protein